MPGTLNAGSGAHSPPSDTFSGRKPTSTAAPGSSAASAGAHTTGPALVRTVTRPSPAAATVPAIRFISPTKLATKRSRGRR